MITITQFNQMQLLAAKPWMPVTPPQAKAPEPVPVAPPTQAASEPAPSDVEPAATTEAPEAPVETAPDATPAADPTDVVAALLVEKLSIDLKRAQHLSHAMVIAGGRLDRVRQVRVVQAEGAPPSAIKRGEFAYVVDWQSAPERGGRPTGKSGRNPRGRGGDRGGGGGGGRMGPPPPSTGHGGKPGAAGSKEKEDPLKGRFSMDAVKEDRKREKMEEHRSGRGRPPPRGRGGPRRGAGAPGGGGGPGGGRPPGQGNRGPAAPKAT